MRTRWVLAAFICLLAIDAKASPVKSLEVAPTTLELKPGEPGLLYVANHSLAPVTVQIDIFDWSQSGNSDHLAFSNTAFVSPPLTTIAPGERQIVRVLAQPTSSEHEGTYRVRVSELPDRRTKLDGVQVLLQFSIPAFVQASKNDSAIAWSATTKNGALEIVAHNNGARAVKLAGLRASSPDGQAKEISQDVNYILPDSLHTWNISAFASPDRLHIEAIDKRTGKPVATDIGIAR